MNAVMRNLLTSDLPELENMLHRIAVFDLDDCNVAMELLTIILNQPGQKDYISIVATDPNSVPIGFTCFGPTPLTAGTFSLYWIAVDPACAGHGLGSVLLQATEEYVSRAGGRMLVLETSSAPCYAKTRQFYVKNNYHLVETIRDFYQEGEDRVTYLKRVDPQPPWR